MWHTHKLLRNRGDLHALLTDSILFEVLIYGLGAVLINPESVKISKSLNK